MSEQNLSDKFNKEDLPVPIPPVDQAWQSMQQRLDVELPVVPHPHAYINLVKGIKIMSTVVTVSVLTWWLYDRKAPSGQEKKIAVEHVKLSDSNILQQPDTPIAAASQFSGDANSSYLPHQLSTQLSPSSAKQTGIPSTQHVSKQPSSIPAFNTIAPGKTLLQHVLQPQLSMSDDNTIAGKSSTPPASSQLSMSENDTTAGKSSTRWVLPSSHNNGKNKGADNRIVLEQIKSPAIRYDNSLQHNATLLPLRPSSGMKEKHRVWSLYLQLNIPLPITGSNHYFMGPDGNNQFYRMLIPAARIEKQLGNTALSLDLRPSVSSILPGNTYNALKNDTTWPAINDTSYTLLKQFGWGLALQYHIPVYKNWRLSAGIQSSFLRKATIQRTVSDSSNIYRTTVYTATSNDWKDFSRLKINGILELYYPAKKWQLGVRSMVPVTRVSNKPGIHIKQPIQVELVYRWRLGL